MSNQHSFQHTHSSISRRCSESYANPYIMPYISCLLKIYIYITHLQKVYKILNLHTFLLSLHALQISGKRWRLQKIRVAPSDFINHLFVDRLVASCCSFCHHVHISQCKINYFKREITKVFVTYSIC